MDFTTTEEDKQFFEDIDALQDLDDSYDFEIKECEYYENHIKQVLEL